MELTYHGGNCIKIAVKKETLIVDGKLSLIGGKDVTSKDAMYVATQEGFNPDAEGMMIDGPGEYEVGGVSVKGIASVRMVEVNDDKKATIYRVTMDGVSFAIVGHVRVPLTEDELEQIGVIDVAVVPVGGNGYTADGHQATSLVKQLEPKLVIPTHYHDSAFSYEVPQQPVDEFIKEMGSEHEKASSYKIKNGALPTTLTVVELERS